jgi:hypothetical protein
MAAWHEGIEIMDLTRRISGRKFSVRVVVSGSQPTVVSRIIRRLVGVVQGKRRHPFGFLSNQFAAQLIIIWEVAGICSGSFRFAFSSGPGTQNFRTAGNCR